MSDSFDTSRPENHFFDPVTHFVANLKHSRLEPLGGRQRVVCDYQLCIVSNAEREEPHELHTSKTHASALTALTMNVFDLDGFYGLTANIVTIVKEANDVKLIVIRVTAQNERAWR